MALPRGIEPLLPA